MPSQNVAIQLQYQVCPIVLSGGIASQILGSMLPIMSLFGMGGIAGLPLLGGLPLPFDPVDLDDAFGAFNVLPGGTLVNQQIAKYPFANQSVAANATIREPLTLSVIMDAPMRGPNAWLIKQAIMTSLKFTLDAHNNAGGTYIVMTPAYMYDNLIMVSMTDNSRSNNSLPQNAWRFDFERPLVALADLQNAQNQLMSKITGGAQITDPSQSGIQQGSTSPQSTLSSNPASLAYSNPALGSTYIQNYGATVNLPAFTFNGIA